MLAVTALLAAPALLARDHADHNPCTSARVAGSWGFLSTGYADGIWSMAVGTETVDSQGNLQGGVIISQGGIIEHDAFSGILTVNPDCTGHLSLNLPRYEFDLVVVDDGKEIVSVNLDPVIVVGTDTKRLASGERCRARSLAGTWGLGGRGEVVGFQTMAGGSLTLDTQGNASGRLILNSILQDGAFDSTFTGTMTVSTDCNGHLHVDFPPGVDFTIDYELAVVDDGDEMFLMTSDPQWIVVFSDAKKVSTNSD
jgi:hypothetical protein